ncbi:MAG: hypothetical protein JNM31_00460 [Flavobacteriales bacterium]|nr:hypothetical protein [Flavobacteriales bacterium]
MSLQFISDRVSVNANAEGVSVVITPRLPRHQEALLVAWTLAWTACGIWFIVELARTTDASLRQGLLVMVAFWAYFELRIGRVLLWRLRGIELIRIRRDARGAMITLKDNILGYGRARDHFVANIQRFGLLAIDESSLRWQLQDSFWVRGGERLGFEDTGRKVAFGKGLTRKEAEAVAAVLEKGLKQARKAEA